MIYNASFKNEEDEKEFHNLPLIQSLKELGTKPSLKNFMDILHSDRLRYEHGPHHYSNKYGFVDWSQRLWPKEEVPIFENSLLPFWNKTSNQNSCLHEKKIISLHKLYMLWGFHSWQIKGSPQPLPFQIINCMMETYQHFAKYITSLLITNAHPGFFEIYQMHACYSHPPGNEKLFVEEMLSPFLWNQHQSNIFHYLCLIEEQYMDQVPNKFEKFKRRFKKIKEEMASNSNSEYEQWYKSWIEMAYNSKRMFFQHKNAEIVPRKQLVKQFKEQITQAQELGYKIYEEHENITKILKIKESSSDDNVYDDSSSDDDYDDSSSDDDLSGDYMMQLEIPKDQQFTNIITYSIIYETLKVLTKEEALENKKMKTIKRKFRMEYEVLRKTLKQKNYYEDVKSIKKLCKLITTIQTIKQSDKIEADSNSRGWKYKYRINHILNEVGEFCIINIDYDADDMDDFFQGRDNENKQNDDNINYDDIHMDVDNINEDDMDIDNDYDDDNKDNNNNKEYIQKLTTTKGCNGSNIRKKENLYGLWIPKNKANIETHFNDMLIIDYTQNNQNNMETKDDDHWLKIKETIFKNCKEIDQDKSALKNIIDAKNRLKEDKYETNDKKTKQKDLDTIQSFDVFAALGIDINDREQRDAIGYDHGYLNNYYINNFVTENDTKYLNEIFDELLLTINLYNITPDESGKKNNNKMKNLKTKKLC